MPGLTRQHEFPNLEALLESEGKPHNTFRVLSYCIPPAVLLFGGASVFLAVWTGAADLAISIGSGVTVALAATAWLIFDRLDRSIPRSKKRVRQLTVKLLSRYVGLGNLVGAEPAIDPEVGALLDEAAKIYLKHLSAEDKGSVFSEARSTAMHALETALAKLLELSEPASAAAQRQAMSHGWAEPLVAEMRELDRALDSHARNALVKKSAEEPLAGLRDARLELQKIDAAVEELEQQQRS